MNCSIRWATTCAMLLLFQKRSLITALTGYTLRYCQPNSQNANVAGTTRPVLAPMPSTPPYVHVALITSRAPVNNENSSNTKHTDTQPARHGVRHRGFWLWIILAVVIIALDQYTKRSEEHTSELQSRGHI